jgi:hypothetical protein
VIAAFNPWYAGDRALGVVLLAALGTGLISSASVAVALGILHWKGKLERRIAGILDPGRDKMTNASRIATCATLAVFLTAAAIAGATRFTTVALAADAPAGAARPPAPPIPNPAPPADPDDPKFAGQFSGQVLGPEGKPFRGARMYVVAFTRDDRNNVVPLNGKNKGAGPARAETDVNGRFDFYTPDMTYRDVDGLAARHEGLISVAADAYASDWTYLAGRTRFDSESRPDRIKRNELTFRLARDDVPIHGRLLGPDGRPVSGARVRVQSLKVPLKRDLDAEIAREFKLFSGCASFEREVYQPELLPGLATETRTDADGRFKLLGIGRDRLAALEISAPSVVTATLTVMTRDAPDVGTGRGYGPENLAGLYGAGFTLKLERGRTISGMVRDGESHQPIAGMWVGPGREGYPRDGVWNRTSTDAQGRFQVTGLPPSVAKWGITAESPPGMLYQSAAVTVTGDSPVVIECRRGIPYQLEVVDEQGRPVEADAT